MQRRAFLTTAGIGTLGLLTGANLVGATPSQATSTTALRSSGGATTLTSAEAEAQIEAQLEDILSALENLPADLQEGSPESTPDYQERLRQELDGLTTVDPELTAQVLGFTPQTGWLCAAELAAFVVTTGVPVFRMIRILNQARVAAGGWNGLLVALRTGQLVGLVGEDSAEILEQILGVNSVIDACMV